MSDSGEYSGEEVITKPIQEKDLHGLLVYVGGSNDDDDERIIHIYKRKNSSYKCNVDTRVVMRDKSYLLHHSADKQSIQKIRDTLIQRCKKEIPSFSFKKYTAGGQVWIKNEHMEKFEDILSEIC
jgi:REP element-mobilizing transposase RayT